MTKLKFYLYFFLILFIFILPPLAAPFFASEEQILRFGTFSPWTAACILASMILFCEERIWRKTRSVLEDSSTTERLLGGFSTTATNSIQKDSSQTQRLSGGAFKTETGSIQKDSSTTERLLGGLSTTATNLIQKDSSKTQRLLGGGEKTQSVLKIKRVLAHAEALKTLGLLCAAAAVFELAGIFLKIRPTAKIIFPKTPVEFILCALTLVCAAFYEEVLYRGFLPFALKTVAEGSSSSSNRGQGSGGRGKDVRWWIAEAVGVLVFAFAHFQNGWIAVLNAGFAGVVLRRCALKTQGIWAGFAAHLIYNAFSLVMMAAIV